jgi:hypothetical protein
MTGDDSVLRLVMEVGKSKTFASALDWPGWSRSNKTEEAAIDALLDYAGRYIPVVRLAGLDATWQEMVDVIDRQPGTATTEFGVPVVIHAVEREPMSEEECARQVALLQACWRFFDEVSRTVSAELRKGSRGGGRDRDKMIDHVIQADRGYGRQIGVRTPPFDTFDVDAVRAHHEAVFAAISSLRDGEPGKPNGWPVRYAIRRMAWHVLDHAWEMQDKDLS